MQVKLERQCTRAAWGQCQDRELARGVWDSRRPNFTYIMPAQLPGSNEGTTEGTTLS